jgi:hypothetical protein
MSKRLSPPPGLKSSSATSRGSPSTDVRNSLTETYDDQILFLNEDYFDSAIIGVGQRCGQPPVVVYDADKCIEALAKQGMTFEEAQEYFDFNVIGAWMGPYTPVFVYPVE